MCLGRVLRRILRHVLGHVLRRAFRHVFRHAHAFGGVSMLLPWPWPECAMPLASPSSFAGLASAFPTYILDWKDTGALYTRPEGYQGTVS